MFTLSRRMVWGNGPAHENISEDTGFKNIESALVLKDMLRHPGGQGLRFREGIRLRSSLSQATPGGGDSDNPTDTLGAPSGSVCFLGRA